MIGDLEIRKEGKQDTRGLGEDHQAHVKGHNTFLFVYGEGKRGHCWCAERVLSAQLCDIRL